MPFPWLAAATIGGAALGFLGQRDSNQAQAGIAASTSAFNAAEAKKQRQWSASEAEKARFFERQMSDSSWQRGVVDMKKAGLNPMLAFSQGGASTPNASAPGGASASGVSANYASPLTGVLNSAQVLAGLDLAAAQADKTSAEARVIEAQVPHAKEHEELKVVMHRTEQQIQNYAHELQKTMYRGGRDMFGNAHGDRAPVQVRKALAEVDDILQEVRTSKSRESLNRSLERLNNLDVPKGMAYADFYKGDVGRAAPYLDQAGKFLGSATGAARDMAISRGIGRGRSGLGLRR